MKGCGKSAPRGRQRGRHGKPRREQDRIGTAEPARASGLSSGPVVRVGRSRRPATAAPEEWPSRRRREGAGLQNPAYRPAGAFIPVEAASRVRARRPMKPFLNIKELISGSGEFDPYGRSTAPSPKSERKPCLPTPALRCRKPKWRTAPRQKALPWADERKAGEAARIGRDARGRGKGLGAEAFRGFGARRRIGR